MGGVDEPVEQAEIPTQGRKTGSENEGLKFRKENEPRVKKSRLRHSYREIITEAMKLDNITRKR